MFTAYDYIRTPSNKDFINKMRTANKTWNEIAEKLQKNSNEKFIFTGDMVRKVHGRKKSVFISPNVKYISDLHNYTVIEQFIKDGLTFIKIAEIISEKSSNYITSETVSKIFKSLKKEDLVVDENIAYENKLQLEDNDGFYMSVIDFISQPHVHKQISEWKNKKLSWEKINNKFNKKFNFVTSVEWLKKSWNKTLVTNPANKTITIRDYLKDIEKLIKVHEMKKQENKTWKEIAKIIQEETKTKFYYGSIADVYNEYCKTSIIDEYYTEQWLRKEEVFSIIHTLRYEELKDWNFIVAEMEKYYNKSIDKNFLIDVVKNKNSEDIDKIKENKIKRFKEIEDFFKNKIAKTENYDDILQDNDTMEEIKTWINYSFYDWFYIADRLSYRHNVYFDATKLRAKYYNESKEDKIID